MTSERPEAFWIFDENRRAYLGPGLSAERDWLACWSRRAVVGETSRSWILEGWDARKIPKRGPLPRGVCRTFEEAKARVAAIGLSAAVHRAASSISAENVDRLARVARALGVAVPEAIERLYSDELERRGAKCK